MKLPNPQNALIDDAKLAAYSLNPNHAEGKHKARVFKSALDLTLDDLADLKATLLEAVTIYKAVPTKANAYGQKYSIDFPMTRGVKTAVIHSVWIIRNAEDFPRLVTCYIL